MRQAPATVGRRGVAGADRPVPGAGRAYSSSRSPPLGLGVEPFVGRCAAACSSALRSSSTAALWSSRSRAASARRWRRSPPPLLDAELGQASEELCDLGAQGGLLSLALLLFARALLAPLANMGGEVLGQALLLGDLLEERERLALRRQPAA